METEFDLEERNSDELMSLAEYIEHFNIHYRLLLRRYDSELSPHQTAQAKVIKNGRNSVVLKLLTRDGETIGITRIHD